MVGKADPVKAHERRLVSAQDIDIVEVVDESGTPIASYDDHPLPDAAHENTARGQLRMRSVNTVTSNSGSVGLERCLASLQASERGPYPL